MSQVFTLPAVDKTEAFRRVIGQRATTISDKSLDFRPQRGRWHLIQLSWTRGPYPPGLKLEAAPFLTIKRVNPARRQTSASTPPSFLRSSSASLGLRARGMGSAFLRDERGPASRWSGHCRSSGRSSARITHRHPAMTEGISNGADNVYRLCVADPDVSRAEPRQPSAVLRQAAEARPCSSPHQPLQ